MGKQYDLPDVATETVENPRYSYTMTYKVDPVSVENGSAYSYTNNGYLPGDGDSYKEKPEEEEKNKKAETVSVTDMFRFAEGRDKFFVILAAITSVLHGLCQPLMIVVFGQMADTFIDDALFGNWLEAHWDNITMYYPNASMDAIMEDPSIIFDELVKYNRTDLIEEIEARVGTDLLDQMQVYAIWYCVIGATVIVLGFTHITCWQSAAYRQCQIIRSKLFKSILKQEIGWFDTHDSGELSNRLSDDVNQIQEGIGDKLGMGMQFIATFFGGFMVGFIKGWKLTLVILAVTPLLVITGGIMNRLGAIFTAKELNAYAKAGAIAEEVLGSMRTVVAFGGERKEIQRYGGNLKDAKGKGIQRGMVTGLGMGAIFLFLFSTFALAFWFGSTLVWEGEYTGGTVLTVFFAVLTASFALGNALPNLQDFGSARGAAYTIYKLIDMVPAIDSSDPGGVKPEKVVGNVEFRNVKFSYPARKNITVLNNLNLKVNVGQTVALVGSSGCGKSTTVQLLQRFYDTDEGQVTIDGIDIREYNLKFMRQHIGVVSQEPVLFDNTIAENIKYGKDGVTQREVEAACKKANAHNFITKLPKGYDTLVGERGTQLSGGQKQRIAIARALVRDPKILLLDEATSALDTESEASVQKALDKAREGRTTLVIAHRLSTIKNADMIVGLENGAIKEQGTHDELMELGGIYQTLVNNQKMQDEEGHLDLGKSPKHMLQQQMSVISTVSDVGSPYGSPSKMQRTLSTTSYGSKKGRSMSFMDEEEVLPEPAMGRIFQLNSSEWLFILIGSISSFIAGGVQPAFALMLSNVIGVYSDLDEDSQRDQVNTYVIMMVGIGIAAGLSMFLMNYMFGYSGEQLTERLRNMTFKCFMRQEIGYFDEHKNSTGALTTRLATDASAVKGATGLRLGTMFRSMSTIAVGLGIGFYYSWKVSLVVLAFAPLMAMAGFIQVMLFHGKASEHRETLEKSGKIATEAIENMRTVAGLTKEDTFHKDYYDLTRSPIKRNMKQAQILGLGYGLSQGCVFFAYAASFSFGATLIQKGELAYDDLYKVIVSIAMGALAVGQANSFAPDYGKAKESAARLFQLFDRVPAIDSFSDQGIKPDTVEGTVSLENVTFQYPTRPDVQVLRGLSLSVEQGQTVALVGSSGCGKSTTIQLLERFYDPMSGSVLLDNNDTTALNIQWLRSQMGIVSQEPVLFDASIKDNIAYGDNSRTIPMDEIIQAAKNANIHSFINSLPLGYDTNVGDKGTQLSGGQKQRVAIARALVRNPKILLLDEATSALDTESEKIVQEALDRAQEGRTCIVIAHRLSTVQNADKIIVIHNGQVEETGTHNELLAEKGIYYNLNMVQMRNTGK